MVDLPAMPERIARRPRDPRGYPIPWFVATVDGVPDFRVVDTAKWVLAMQTRRCWVCGEPLGSNVAFVIGPMCAINKITSEPGSHLECARWSARACPFLTRPRMRRNEKDLPEDGGWAAGFGIKRNPGVALIWVTRKFKAFRTRHGKPGYLIELGQPTSVLWYAEGRLATRAEVLASIESGYPALLEMCKLEAGEALQAIARRELERQYQDALELVPAV